MKKIFNGIYIVSTLCVIIVMLLRVLGNTYWGTPIDLLTSGKEEESLFAIWKYIYDQPIFKDPYTIPYAASYFNWLFYYFYGFITDVLQQILHFSDAWIPQTARYISFASSVTGSWLSVLIIRNITGKKALSIFHYSMIICFWFGYFVGFWVFTVRPDMWALVMEVAALLVFIKYRHNNKMMTLVWSAILFYLSFSFKQSFFGVAVGCWFLLVIRKQYKEAVLFALIPIALVAATLAIGGEEYRWLLIESQMGQGLVLKIGLSNFKLGYIKMFCLTGTATFVIIYMLARYSKNNIVKRIIADDIALLLTLTGILSFLLFFVTCMKRGASENYFVSPYVLLIFILSYTVHKIQAEKDRTMIYTVYALASVIYIGLGMMIITGRQGVVKVDSMTKNFATLKQVIDKNEQPLYVENNYGNLPWINPAEHNFVLATTYYILLEEPERLEEGGVEGLMDKGYFNTIIGMDLFIPDHKELYYVADTISNPSVTLYVWKKK